MDTKDLMMTAIVADSTGFDLMRHESHETSIDEHALDVYYQRMSNSIGDKKTLLPYIKGQKVLDIGCGSGDLINALKDLGYDAYGIDASEESVRRCDDPHVKIGYADEVDIVFGEQMFDTIICCSVLHEVFSYGNRFDKIGQVLSVSHAIDAMKRALKPGGRLLVRDGVMPDDASKARMTVDNPAEVDKFLKRSPFAAPTAGLDRQLSLVQVGECTFEGTPSSIMEFAFTYTWGPGSFEREVMEFYGLFTLEDYANFVSDHGFVCTHKHAYTQPGYRNHLEGKVMMNMPFPHSNAIWVYDLK
jgi:SAM-dependent methyltransferase